MYNEPFQGSWTQAHSNEEKRIAGVSQQLSYQSLLQLISKIVEK